MTISLNGKEADTRGARTIEELITRYDLPAPAILVEHNGLALHRREWAGRLLTTGDCVEVVRVVAGG